MFEFLAGDAGRREPETIAIETQRPLEIVHSERDD
jgi:hypothetical protein